MSDNPGSRRPEAAGNASVPDSSVSPGRTLLVAAGGGHLAELVELRQRIDPVGPHPLWMVPDGEQSRDLLRGEDVLHAPSVHPRDLRNLAAATAVAQKLLSRESIGRVISTGSAVAVAAFLPARARAIPCHYIESAARVDGPSLTGRLVQRLPGVQLYSQCSWPERRRWRHCGSVFDGFEPVRRSKGSERLRVVVTVGTMAFGFRRLLERLVSVLSDDAEVVWQTGHTDVRGLRINSQPWLTAAELHVHMQRADVVLAHAGVGSALSALQAGAYPMLLPRRSFYQEHVDDHQVQIARALAARGLATWAEPEQLSRQLIEGIIIRAVRRREGGVAPIALGANRLGRRKLRL